MEGGIVRNDIRYWTLVQNRTIVGINKLCQAWPMIVVVVSQET